MARTEAVRRGEGLRARSRVPAPSNTFRESYYLYISGPRPSCLDAADAEDNGFLNITDILRILNDFFRDGTAIPDPGPFHCGPDPSPDRLDCESYPPCL